MEFIVYNKAGKILRTVSCPLSHRNFQAKEGEFVMEGTANDVTQKIINIGIAGKIVNKTLEEIEADNPPQSFILPKQTAQITNEQWQDVLDRLAEVEAIIVP